MRAILPGRPQAKLQAVTTGLWEGIRVIAYISGNALIVLSGPSNVLQTTYHDREEELVAVDFDETSGKLSTCSKSQIYVYKPYGREEDAVRWSLQCTLRLQDPKDSITTLSWGLDEELLVGSSSLSLFTTHNSEERIWSKPLANPAKFAEFCHDATMVATAGQYDRMVKIWRRLTAASADQRFDYGYLPHPTTVTGIHWRRPVHKEQTIDKVLFTTCADNKLRIWANGDPHGLRILHLWGEIDLLESIQPRSIPPALRSKKRYAFIIDSREFIIATERAVEQASNGEKDQQSLEHLIAVANRAPEVCVVLDDQGHMSAWGIESIGAKIRKRGDIFNIAHIEGLKLHFAKGATGTSDRVQFTNFCGNRNGDTFTLLSHHFDGRLEWLEGRLDRLFDPFPQNHRLEREAIWTGHCSPIKKVVRTATGRAIISRTTKDESAVWIQKPIESGMTIARHSVINTTEHIHRVWLLQEGDFVVFLHHQAISLWDTRGPVAEEVARRSYKLNGKPLCLILIPEVEADEGCVHLATVSSEMKGVSWEVRLPPKRTAPWEFGRRVSTIGSLGKSWPSLPKKDIYLGDEIALEQFDTFELGAGDEFSYVLPVDPAGTAPAISGFLDTFARDIAISYSASGVLKTWTARVNRENRKLEWLLTSTTETSIENPSLASATSIRKAAMVDAERTLLTIWNTRSAQLEYEERFENQFGAISDLDWSSTPDNQSILAVGFPHRVRIYAQLRYDYLNAGPSWAPIRQIVIRDLTAHPIGDSVWLGSGNLVIGAGNQLFVQDEHVEVSDSLLPDLRLVARKNASMDIFTVVSRLNGPLPVFHPQFLSQCILAGKLMLAQRILINLRKTLKFFTEGDEIDNFLGLSPDEFSEDLEASVSVARKEMHSSYADFTEDLEPDTVTEEVAASLNELLTQCQVPLLSSREQFHLADIIECVGTVEKHRRSIDDNACRFLLFFRQHVLRTGGHASEQMPISWREITWAYHSGSQDILVDLVSRHFQSKMLWKHARDSGMFMWMNDGTALRSQFEVIARNEYTKSDDRNPVDCSLFYLALKKKPVLVGLWRMANGAKEQAATQKLLANNFNEPRWRTAALKNAYALMGKRRFQYAAAFFLLADHLQDAVSVLSNQMQDLQLAIAVARVYEGDDGPVLKRFLRGKVLPQAARDGNRWLATWAFWMINRKDNAVRALVTPLTNLLSPPESPNMQSKLFLTDDPALVVLYKQLREKSLQTLRGAIMVAPRAEWEFVLHTARLYERMGCDLLALDLVRTWEFLAQPSPIAAPLPPLPTALPIHSRTLRQQTHPPSALDAFDIDPRKILRRRSSLVVVDLPPPSLLDAYTNGTEQAVEDGKDETKKRIEAKTPKTPTMFNEPDANSLLDAFGF